MTFHFTCDHIILSSIWVVEWPPFGQLKIKSLYPLRAKKIFIRKAEDLGFDYKSLIGDPTNIVIYL